MFKTTVNHKPMEVNEVMSDELRNQLLVPGYMRKLG